MIWIDVEDLFQYVRSNARPSGIQRVEYELCRALAEMDAAQDLVRFVRHKPLTLGYYSVAFSLLDDNFRSLGVTGRTKTGLFETAGRPRRSALSRMLHAASEKLPARARAALVKIYYHQKSAFVAVGELAVAIMAGLHALLSSPRAHLEDGSAEAAVTAPSERLADPPANMADEFEPDVRPGDVLMLLGSAWFPGYAAMVERVVRQKQVRVALLIYDIVPLRRPEWCNSALIGVFTDFVRGVLPLADVLLTISRASARDIDRYARETGLELRSAPTPIPMGTGFTVAPSSAANDTGRDGAAEMALASLAEPTRLPEPGSYALIVSTIEARKNHGLLFRVWRRLLEDMPADRVPTLVFAGRVGWLVADLMGQLRNAAFLGGKIVVIEDPTDAELALLYEGCMFTLFPSFYEGWGLPVTESLGYGRPCIISNATSLPEAGGSLARYFDPDSPGEAYEVIRSVIENPAELAAWRARIAAEFVPVSWASAAHAIMTTLFPPSTDAGCAEPEPEPESAVGLAV